MSELYEFDAKDDELLSAAKILLKKVAVAETTRPAQLVTVAKLLHVLAVLPRVTTGVTASVSVSCPRHQFDDIETFHWLDFAVKEDRLCISSGGHFYQPSSGGDTFTTMGWIAIPEEPAELDDYRDHLWMVPDVRSFPEGVESIDLSAGGYTVEIVDDDNPLLAERQDEDVEDEDAGVEIDKDEAEKWLKRGLEHRDRGQYEEAFASFKRGIELNPDLPELLLFLGACYDGGQGVLQDCAEAASYYRKAAERGLAEAQLGLAYLYNFGQGVPQDFTEAAKWYCKAAEQGFAIAQCSLGCAFAHGCGVPQDHAQAAAWYRKAAEQGFRDAQRLLGNLYRDGKGVPQDSMEAAIWWRKAAEQGDEDAQAALAAIWKTGPKPVSSPTLPIPTLQDAIASYKVTAEFSGNGASSGDSVLVELSKGLKAGPEPLEAILPAGSVLVGDDASVQNMMVVSVRGILRGGNKYQPETQIVLTGSDSVDYVLTAYCMQFEKENPSDATRFSLKPPDPALARIAEKGASLTVPAMQAAVWMQTDKITYYQMNQKFPITPEDWAAGETVVLECRNGMSLKGIHPRQPEEGRSHITEASQYAPKAPPEEAGPRIIASFLTEFIPGVEKEYKFLEQAVTDALRIGQTEFQTEVLIFGLHCLQRTVFAHWGAEYRKVFMDSALSFVNVTFASVLSDEVQEGFSARFEKHYKERQREYSAMILPITEGSPNGTLFYEFGKMRCRDAGVGNPEAILLMMEQGCSIFKMMDTVTQTL